MPVRRASWPAGASMQLYRRFTYGDLASFFVLDTRQYRSDQPCGDRLRPVCPGVMDPNATLLGIAQKTWLQEGLDSSTTRWNVIPQQVMMARLDRGRGEEEEIGMDTWSGYEMERRNLLEFLARRQPENQIVLTGDIHSNWVNDLRVDYQDPALPPIGTEFVEPRLAQAATVLTMETAVTCSPGIRPSDSLTTGEATSVVTQHMVSGRLITEYLISSPVRTVRSRRARHSSWRMVIPARKAPESDSGYRRA